MYFSGALPHKWETHSVPFSAFHVISKILREQGLKTYNCSELKIDYGIFFLLMTSLQYKMHSKVSIISGLADFFFALLFLSSFVSSLISLHSSFFAQNIVLHF